MRIRNASSGAKVAARRSRVPDRILILGLKCASTGRRGGVRRGTSVVISMKIDTVAHGEHAVRCDDASAVLMDSVSI